MKTLNSLLDDFKKKALAPKLIHILSSKSKDVYLCEPKLSDEVRCPTCWGNEGFFCFTDPHTRGEERMWSCTNLDCPFQGTKEFEGFERRPPSKEIQKHKIEWKRAIEWESFCRNMGIGNNFDEVIFENIQQSNAKKEFMKGFASSPQGIVIMQGLPGTGKTYASLGICEYFTRNSWSCYFITQMNLMKKWLKSVRGDGDSDLKFIEECSLLVIDDFGITEPSPGFMAYFMDLINTRMQWKDRGTIISTSLDEKKMALFCGDALSDRLSTGQTLLFTGKSRRKPPIT